jgi:tripeptide aminopeptidase
MTGKIQSILKSLPEYCHTLTRIREILLASTVMIGEIPAPTFNEKNRLDFLCSRLTENKLQNICMDEAGNAQAILPGKSGKKNILVVAHADTVFDETVDHTINVSSHCLSGPGIADNSLGLSVLASLPEVLQTLGVELENNLIFLGESRNLGRGDLEGIRFFLDNVKTSIDAGVCVEGVQLGRLSYSCLGTIRGEINCSVPAETNELTPFNPLNAIIALNKIVSKILAIPLPTQPKANIVLGSLHAGATFNRAPQKGSLRFEILSEDTGIITQVKEMINEIIEEVSAEIGTKNRFEIIAQRNSGGIPFTHELVKSTRMIMESLKIKPIITPSVGDLSGLIFKKIPAITLGITKGRNLHEKNETILIEPIYRGLAQLVGVLQVIDSNLGTEKSEKEDT